MQSQHRFADQRAVRRIHRHCYAVSFGVERVADLHQVAVALSLILDARRFHEKRVPAFALEYSVYALLVALREHGRVRRFHHAPHPLVQTQVRSLKKTGGRSFLVTAVLDVRVFRQVIDVLDRCFQTSAGNRRCQVGGVRRGHDQREKPPHARH